MDERESSERVYRAGLQCMRAVNGMPRLEGVLALVSVLGELTKAGTIDVEEAIEHLRRYVRETAEGAAPSGSVH
jgi:hypothetical protein